MTCFGRSYMWFICFIVVEVIVGTRFNKDTLILEIKKRNPQSELSFERFKGDYQNVTQRIDLKCVKHNFNIDNMLIKDLLSGHVGCPVCKYEKAYMKNLSETFHTYLGHHENFLKYSFEYTQHPYFGSGLQKTPLYVRCQEHGLLSNTHTLGGLSKKKYICQECFDSENTIKHHCLKPLHYYMPEIMQQVEDKVRVVSDLDKDVFKKSKIFLICNGCGTFSSKTLASLLDCKVPCGCYFKKHAQDSLSLTLDDFISKSMSKFGTMAFQYDDVIYEGNSSFVKLVCSVHGNIEITAAGHLKSITGCQHCSGYGLYDHKEKAYTNTAKKNHKQTFLYVYHLTNVTESFYKIGISVDPFRRLRTIRSQSGYQISIPYLIKGSLELIPVVEKEIHLLLKDFHHTPSKFFSGSKTECFSSIDGILDHIPFDQVEVITDLLSQQEIAT